MSPPAAAAPCCGIETAAEHRHAAAHAGCRRRKEVSMQGRLCWGLSQRSYHWTPAEWDGLASIHYRRAFQDGPKQLGMAVSQYPQRAILMNGQPPQQHGQ